MRRVRIQNLGGARAVILHRPHDTVQALERQLIAIGLKTAQAWPELGPEALGADFVFFDADMGHDGQFPWSPGQSPMPMIALIGSEAPGRIEWALAAGAHAQLLKPVVFLIAAAGMVVFGGRAATGLVVLFVAWHVLRRVADVVRGRPFDPALVLVGLVGLPVLAGGVLVLGEAGFFDKFLSRLIDDHGSASTRVEMFELFKHLSWAEILLGPNADYVHNLMRHYGLDYGIESFWVAVVLAYGMIAGVVFFVGLFLFCSEVVKVRPASLAAILYFFAVASASLSLSAKTHGFSMFVVMILVLLPRVRTDVAPAALREPDDEQEAGRTRLQVA